MLRMYGNTKFQIVQAGLKLKFSSYIREDDGSNFDRNKSGRG
jgi:hypothetical protein